MSQTGVVDFLLVEEQTARVRVADLVSRAIFASLLLLVAVTPLPYGTIEPWWKAAFVCAVFAVCIMAVLESLLSGSSRIQGGRLLLPMLALTALALLQTFSFGSMSADPGLTQLRPWNAISADPFQTRFFVLQFLALTACLALLYKYASTERRIRVLVYVVIGVAVASAIFGILRQTTQHEIGFVLPLMRPNRGYGQFINKNHFAYLMEMAFGLGLGIILAGGVKRDRVMLFVACLLPIWTGLVLSNSRGGILAMLAQVLLATLLFVSLAATFGIDSRRGSYVSGPRSLALRTTLLVILIGAIFIGTLWVGGDKLVSNFETVSGEFNQDAAGMRDGNTRNEIWRASLKMFASHPILGVGLGGYWIGITAYHDASGLVTPQEAHNDYLELLSSGGLVGFAVGIWFAVLLFRKARENFNAESGFKRAVRFGAVLGIAGVAVHSLVDFGLHIMANAVVFVTLIMLATTKIHSESKGFESESKGLN